MQRIMNNPDNIVDEMLKGFLKAHSDIVESTENGRVVKAKDIPEGKVGVVTGGGSGHKPAFIGYVGKNMCDAAAVGEICSSPTAAAFLDAFKATDQGKGVACLYGNYSGDNMNVKMAVKMAKRAGLLHDIGKAVDHEMEGSHIQLGVDLCRRYKESALVINAVEAHHGDVEPESLIACLVQAADTISAARPGARRETLETYTNRLKQLEDITNSFKGVEKSFAIQAGREIRVMVIPEVVSDSDMVLMARDISKQIESQMEYPGQIKVSVIRESRVVDYAK